MEVKSEPLSFYTEKIKRGKPFSFVRYGDGEWSAVILHNRQRTGSGSQNLTVPGLRRGLRESLQKCYVADNYCIGVRPSSLTGVIRKWLEKNLPQGVTLRDSRTFYLASKKGNLRPFVLALRNLEVPIVVIGPTRLRGLSRKVFKITRHIEIPGRDAFRQKDGIIAQALAIEEPAFFSISAGPLAKILVHQLYGQIGDRSFLFDLGSLWDPYVGVATRTYHRGMLKRGEEIKRNVRYED